MRANGPITAPADTEPAVSPDLPPASDAKRARPEGGTSAREGGGGKGRSGLTGTEPPARLLVESSASIAEGCGLGYLRAQDGGAGMRRGRETTGSVARQRPTRQELDMSISAVGWVSAALGGGSCGGDRDACPCPTTLEMARGGGGKALRAARMSPGGSHKSCISPRLAARRSPRIDDDNRRMQ